MGRKFEWKSNIYRVAGLAADFIGMGRLAWRLYCKQDWSGPNPRGWRWWKEIN
jgi:hypothetical protein